MSCEIYLENYNSVYHPGDEIRGKVVCCFNEEITVRGIKVRLKCNEYNSWRKGEMFRKPPDIRVEKLTCNALLGNNYVLDLEEMLFGSNSGSNVLSSGRYVYPFSFVLPSNIPASFNGPYGCIAYKLKAIVDRPMWVDYKNKLHFKVEAPIDFNKMSTSLQEPASYNKDKTLCCSWCCRSGELTMTVDLPKRAFVPGETLNCVVHVTNMSNANVEHLGVKLKKTLKYRVERPRAESRQNEEDLVSFKEHGVGAHGQHTYNLQLDIPSHVVVPNFAQCRLFEVDYLFRFSCHMASCVLDLHIDIHDVVLGHIAYGTSTLPPRMEVHPLPVVDLGFDSSPTAPLLESSEVDLPPSYYETQQDVPTYRECEEAT